MADAILATCSACGKAFNGSKHKTNKFCSPDCYRTAQRNGLYKHGHRPTTFRSLCANCGNVVIGSPSKKRNGEKSDVLFCNRTCYDSYRRKIVESRNVKCKNCGNEFETLASSVKRVFCSVECKNAHKRAKPKNCVNCQCLFTSIKLVKKTGKYIGYNAGKTCSSYCHNQWIRNDPERKRKIGDAFRGANHPNWQGGKSLWNNIHGRGPNWQKQRQLALKRDKYMCVDCGITNDECIEKFGRGLDVDHMTPFHNFGNFKKANALSNLECRCASCHKKKESTRGMVQMLLPMQDGEKRMHKGKANGERHPNAKLRIKDVVDIRRMADDGRCFSDIAVEFNVKCSNISSIVKGKVWKNVPLGETHSLSRIGRNGGLRGEQNGLSKATEGQIRSVRDMVLSGASVAEAARTHGLSYAIAYQAVVRKTWKHVL